MKLKGHYLTKRKGEQALTGQHAGYRIMRVRAVKPSDVFPGSWAVEVQFNRSGHKSQRFFDVDPAQTNSKFVFWEKTGTGRATISNTRLIKFQELLDKEGLASMDEAVIREAVRSIINKVIKV